MHGGRRPTLARRLLALAALASLALTLAACGSSRESAGHFVTRILREEISGQWAAQWDELHPGQQKLITRDDYVLCSERMGTNVAGGHEKYAVRGVRQAPLHEQGVPERSAELVTISVAGPRIHHTFMFHAVLHDGHWCWVLGPSFLAAIAQGHCLDGTPLGGPPGSAS